MQDAKSKHPNDADSLLKSMYQDQGFDGKPQLVTQAEYNKLSRQGKIHKIYRGMSAAAGRTGTDFANDYKTGDYFAGVGVFGNGTYASPKKGVANQYARFGGAVMTMGLRKDAKTTTYTQLKNEFNLQVAARKNELVSRISQAQAQFNSLMSGSAGKSQLYKQLKRMRDELDILTNNQREHATLGDIGRFAVSRGYDAFQVDTRGVNHWIILNRTATYVVQ